MSELNWDITGYDEPPIELLESSFREIAKKEMQALPFYRENIPVKAGGFTLFEKQWIGTILTPWMLANGAQYLACSLMSPLDRHLQGEQAVELAENSAKMALSLPVQTQSVTEVDLSRRSLFRGQLRS